MKWLFALIAVLAGVIVFKALPDNTPKAGEIAPVFTLKSQLGKNVSLGDFKGQWVVLYFYPKDFTSGCSIEAKTFQDDSPKYKEKNAVIIGVSVDSVDSHREFCIKEGLGFSLLSDENKEVSILYGSYDKLIGGTASRNTFLIDPEGVVRKAYLGVNPTSHSAEVLKDLEALVK
jgi:peroxiredoxin Q/BCP